MSDDTSHMKAIQKTIDDLSELRDRLPSPRSRMRDRPRVTGEVEKIMQRRATDSLLQIKIIEKEEVTLKQKAPGRRSESTQYVREVKLRFDLTWKIDAIQLERARRCDGIFPLITKDRSLTAEEVQRTYERQPMIEKRFSQFKSDFHVAPVFLKVASRIESLLPQTLLERELRRTTAFQAIESLPLYPESRDCKRPTARRVIDAMENISRHRLITEDGAQQDLYTDPTPLQYQLIKLFGDEAAIYGQKH